MQGGISEEFTPQTALFLHAVSDFTGQGSFYESASTRDAALVELVRAVVADDPDGHGKWLADFVHWLRRDARIRTMAIVVAAQSVRWRIAAGHTRGGNREIIRAALARPDEPGEMLAYWKSQLGGRLPKPVKRGVADAVAALYHERAWLKWDSPKAAYRFADVIQLVHAKPRSAEQAELWRYFIGKRLGDDVAIPEAAVILSANAGTRMVEPDDLRELAKSDPAGLVERLQVSGMTWEDIPSLVNGAWTAELWEAIIPSMGVMALMRNLRNFDEAGVSDQAAQIVAAKLADPAEVERARVLPMRFLSAYNAAPSLRWAWPLEQGLQASLANIPEMDGHTLIMVDTSGSMGAPFSRDGSLHRWDAAALFGLAVAQRCEAATVMSFSTSTREFRAKRGESLLSQLKRWKSGGYFIGAGTSTEACLRASLRPEHTRVLVLTDEMNGGWGGGRPESAVPARVPMYTYNLAGYRVGHGGGVNRVRLAGLSDAMFQVMSLTESALSAGWPWEV